MRRLLPVLLVLALAGCGHSGGSPSQAESGTTTTAVPPPTAPTSKTTPAEEPRLAVRVYFVRDGRVAPVRRLVPNTPAVGQAALDALSAGPTDSERADGLSTAIGSLRLTGLSVQNGEADLGQLTHVSQLAEAQIVYTLTQFSTVREVRIGDNVLDRADLEDVTPVILVEAPLPGDTVSSPIAIRGTSDTFEATMRVEVRRGSTVLVAETVTASSGSGQRGTFAATLDVNASPGPITLVAFEPSAENGQPLHTVTVPLTLR
jgi:immunoglobulin-like protein involved in spore germination/sporulation and spore germination protein